MLFVVLCPGTLEGSTDSGSGFKASQKTGQRLQVSSLTDLEKPGIEPATPGLQGGWLKNNIERSQNYIRFFCHNSNLCTVQNCLRSSSDKAYIFPS